MSDFQFAPDPEHYGNPEENIKGIVHTPGVTDFTSPHSLGAEAPLKPDIEGGALAGLGAPKKPTLHVGEPIEVSGTNFMHKEAATSAGGKVSYIYDLAGKPLSAAVYSKEGKWAATHYPESVDFPSAPTSKPVLPTLHIGEPEHVGGYTGSAKTEDGGMIFYNYHADGKPASAELYDAQGNFKNDELTPYNIAFPEFTSLKQKIDYPAEMKGLLTEANIPTVHENYSTQFAHYKNFDDDKPEFEFTKPLESSAKDVAIGTLQNGNKLKIFYGAKGEPVVGNEETSSGTHVVQHVADDVNLPQHPLEQVPWAPEKPTLHIGEPVWAGPASNEYKDLNGDTIVYHYKGDGTPWFATPLKNNKLGKDLTPNEINFPAYKNPETIVSVSKSESQFSPSLGKIQWGPDPNSQEAHAHAIIKGEVGHIYYDYVNGKPAKAEFFDSHGDSKYKFTPDQIKFPSHLSKPSLAKVNLKSDYPEEEPIEELYKPAKASHYPEAQFSTELTPEETRSVRKYTESYYSDINSYVREKSNLNAEGFERNNYHEGHMTNLDSAISKASLPEAITVYRGISPNLFDKFSSRLEPGETILHQNYMSTSSRHEFAKSWKGGHTMIIETPAGAHALPVDKLSSNSGEHEILFPRDTKLKLIKKEPHTLYFEVVP